MATPTRKQIAKALVSVTNQSGASLDSPKLAKAIALYLSENRRTKDLDGLLRDIMTLRADAGVVEVTVTSAFPLTPSLKRDVRSLIAKQHGAKEVILNEVVDPEVLGGLRIETGEQQLDVTVQQKLNRLKRAIV